MDELKALFITGLILLFLLLILQLRLRILAEFGEKGARLQLRIALFHLTLYPMRQKPEKSAQEKRKKKQASPPQDKAKKERFTAGMSLEFFREILDLALESLHRVRTRLQIDELFLRLDWGLEDPADAAISYGCANAVLSGILALLEVGFQVKKQDAGIQLDYTLDTPKVYARCSCSLRLRQVLSLGLCMGVRGLHLYRSGRRQRKTAQGETVKQKKEAV